MKVFKGKVRAAITLKFITSQLLYQLFEKSQGGNFIISIY